MTYKKSKIAVFAVTVIMIFTFVFSFSSLSASAAKYGKIPASTAKVNTFAKAYKYVAKGKTSYGFDWTYNTYSKDIKVSCKYNFKTKSYTFRIKGKKYGLAKVILKYKKNNKTWVSVPMKVFVDPKNNIMRTKIK